MTARFTLGIEEEFQLVNLQTGDLRSCADAMIEKGMNSLGEQLKPEMSQSTIELVSNILRILRRTSGLNVRRVSDKMSRKL